MITVGRGHGDIGGRPFTGSMVFVGTVAIEANTTTVFARGITGMGGANYQNPELLADALPSASLGFYRPSPHLAGFVKHVPLNQHRFSALPSGNIAIRERFTVALRIACMSRQWKS